MATDGSSMEQITNKLMERQNLKRGDRGAVQNPGGPAHPRGRRGLGVRRHLRRLMPGQSPHVRSWWSSPPPVLACFCSPSPAICIRAVAWLPVVVRQQRGPLSVGCARYQILVCLCVLGRAGHPRPQTLVARFDVVRVLADGGLPSWNGGPLIHSLRRVAAAMWATNAGRGQHTRPGGRAGAPQAPKPSLFVGGTSDVSIALSATSKARPPMPLFAAGFGDATADETRPRMSLPRRTWPGGFVSLKCCWCASALPSKFKTASPSRPPSGDVLYSVHACTCTGRGPCHRPQHPRRPRAFVVVNAQDQAVGSSGTPTDARLVLSWLLRPVLRGPLFLPPPSSGTDPWTMGRNAPGGSRGLRANTCSDYSCRASR